MSMCKSRVYGALCAVSCTTHVFRCLHEIYAHTEQYGLAVSFTIADLPALAFCLAELANQIH